ncbi:threonine dehydratase [Aliiroseovarius halocynthiae]|uniref:Threonine/serine dehydratase n=2 Tax=Aliiroseovarius halocynthiae TaxID=985055 RepID=A0A545SYL2_9RHOB|nr:threonine/serine dehydratase [Aliiroseovarius halocynthiae]TQV70057.1 threonine/serine dehydratase [Aliiroseovarius halocynthiae]SMR70645.1 threonine dehydratase [Aliiroseovarius halocynthiae]
MNINEIRNAARRNAGHVRRTPLLTSPFLDEIAGRQVFVKPECLQHTGSFKYRGAHNAISQLSAQQRELGVIAYSSGNHAQGIALAARQNQTPATIVMPSDAPQLKIDNTRALGAKVVLYNRMTEDRDQIGADLSRQHRLTLIKPFDNKDVIAGQGTVGLEIANQARDAGIRNAQVLVPCGGGGLTAGIAIALEHDAPDMTVRPVEPADFDDVTRSLHAEKIEINEKRSGSICDAILTPAPGDLTFPVMTRLCGAGIVVTDKDCLRAMALAFTRLKLVIEPGGAVALAAALFQPLEIKGDAVIVVVSGGNVDAPLFADALNRFA